MGDEMRQKVLKILLLQGFIVHTTKFDKSINLAN